MTTDQARLLTEDTIVYKLRHADYGKCCEIAKKSCIYVTGEGQDTEYLIPMRDRETGRQKDIRVKVTKPITPFALNPVWTEFQKMHRVDGVTFSVEPLNAGGDIAIVNEAINTYHSNAPMSSYFERRFVHWNFLDANGWHITERRNKLNEFDKVVGIDVYPLEVTSEQAVNYQYDNGVPKWLIARQERTEMVVTEETGNKLRAEEKTVCDYFFYAAGIALRYSGYIQTPLQVDGNDIEGERVILNEMAENENDRLKFVFAAFETGSKEFPGHKWGAYDERESGGTVKVPPFWDGARFILDDLIETKSVFDVSRHNHVFPKLFHYDQPCGYVSQDGGACHGGYMDDAKTYQCPECEGTGSKMHFGESDIITFNIMEMSGGDVSNLPPLSSLAYYHQPPLDVTKELYQWIKDFLEWVYIASFNSTNVDKAFVAKTATEIGAIFDAINARVYNAATWWSRMSEKAVRVTGQYLGTEVVASHYVPMDMKLESLDVLLARYAAASGMPYEVRQAILYSIFGKTFPDNPVKIGSIKAWEYWRPFKSMTNDTVLFLLQGRANDDFDKLLFENWDNVQIDVANTLKEKLFAEQPLKEQYRLIQEAVGRISEKIKYLGDGGGQFPDLTAGLNGNGQAGIESPQTVNN